MSQAWVKENKSKSSRRNEVRDLLMSIIDKVNLMVVESKNFSIILHYSILKWLMLSKVTFYMYQINYFNVLNWLCCCCIKLTLVCFELTCIETTLNQNNHRSLPDITIECSMDWYWKLFGVLWERSPHNPTVF